MDLEKAAENPATKAVVDLFARYAPGGDVTLPALKAMSAWLLFAKSDTGNYGKALTLADVGKSMSDLKEMETVPVPVGRRLRADVGLVTGA